MQKAGTWGLCQIVANLEIEYHCSQNPEGISKENRKHFVERFSNCTFWLIRGYFCDSSEKNLVEENREMKYS